MPDVLNPTAAAQYVATNQRRADVAQAQGQITRIEAMKPDEKRAALNNNGFDAGQWAQFKTAFSYPLNQDDRDALEQQGEQVEQKPGDKRRPMALENPAIDPVFAAADAATGGVTAGIRSAVMQGEGTEAAKMMGEHVTNNPYVKAVTGIVAPMLLRGPGSGGILDLIERALRPGGAEGAVEGAAEGAAKGVEGGAEGAKLNIRADTPTAQNFQAILDHPEANENLKSAVQSLRPAVRDPETGTVYLADKPEARSHAEVFNDLPPEVQAKEKLDTGFVGKDDEYMTRQQAQDHLIEAQKQGTTLEPSARAAGSVENGGPAQSVETEPTTEIAPTAHSDAAALENARANPMTHEEMQGIEVDGEEGHQLPKVPLSYSDLVRAQSYTGQVADSIVSAQRRFLQSGSDEDAAALEEAKNALTEITPQMRAIWHQAGLTLQKVGAGDPSSAQIRSVFEALEQNASMPERMAAALANLPSVAERAKMIEDAASMSGSEGWTAKGALYKLYVNSILSLNSAGKKAVSDAANIIFQVPARGLAEVGSRVFELGTGAERGSAGVAPGETHALVRGMLDNFGDSLRVGLDSARKGKPMFEGDVGFLDNPHSQESVMGGSGFESTWWGRGLDYYGHLVSVPGKSIIGIDQFAKSMQFNMELQALAHRQGFIEAAGEGLSGAEQAGRASELAEGYLKKTPGWMTDQAMQTAKVNTFQEDLQGNLAAFDKVRRGSYFLRTIAPFFKTPVNITLQGIRQSPLAPMSGVWRQTVAGGGPEAAIAMSKTALGSAIGAYLTYHVLKGNITGGIPENLKGTLRDDWLVDHQPYSIRSGDGDWHSYQGLEPLAWVLGMTADAAPSWAYLNSAEAEHAHGSISQAIANEINRQPMWGALHMVFHAVDDTEKGRGIGAAIGETGSRMAAGLIPSMAANLAGGIDPVRRKTEGIFEDIRNRIPWLKENGLESLDTFARPVIVPPGFLANEFPAFVSTKKRPDAVVDEMIRLKNAVGFEPPQIPPSIGPHITADSDDANAQDAIYGAKLSDAEQNRWNELRNNPGIKGQPTLYDSLAKLIQDPRYQNLSDSAQAGEWHTKFTGYQSMGHDALLNENEGVRGRMMAAYVGKGKARTQGRPAIANIGAP